MIAGWVIFISTKLSLSACLRIKETSCEINYLMVVKGLTTIAIKLDHKSRDLVVSLCVPKYFAIIIRLLAIMTYAG